MNTLQPKRKALGKGLSSLLGDRPTPELLAQATLISIAKIKPNQFQPRSRFDEEELAALTESIRKDGVLMPILIRPKGDGFELIAGERRWRAAQAAQLHEIPAVVRNVDDLQALELAIVENEQRDDLTAVESARAYKRLITEFNYTQQQVAESIGISRVQVSNLIRLLQLPESIQAMLESRKISMGQARPLVGVDAPQAVALAVKCVEEEWSARQMEREVKKITSPMPSTQPMQRMQPTVDMDIQALEQELNQALSMRVQLARKTDGSGYVKVNYRSQAELDVLLKQLRTAE